MAAEAALKNYGARASHFLCRYVWDVREETAGQGTVEYAIVVIAFVCVLAAGATLWHVLSDGVFIEHTLTSASHNIQDAGANATGDIFIM